jgi:hypothetical protein
MDLRKIIGSVTLLIPTLVLPICATALLFRLLSPLQLARYSATVFAGTAVRSHTERTSGRIITTVTFRNLRIAKGLPVDSISLVLEGGTIGGEMVAVDGQPGFQVGDRYIVFASDSKSDQAQRWYLPVVGLYEGLFLVRRDAATGEARVFNSLGFPLVPLTPERAVVVRPDSFLPERKREQLRRMRIEGKDQRAREEAIPLWEDEDPGTRVTEEEFLEIVRGFPAEDEPAPATAPRTR